MPSAQKRSLGAKGPVGDFALSFEAFETLC
jgi:hypothetical protein